MATTDDDYAQMLLDDDDEGKKPAAIMWVTQPALNSCELSLRGERDKEQILAHDIYFADQRDDESGEPENDPERVALRAQLADHWADHIAIARATGRDGTYQDYGDICIAEGLVPVPLADYPKYKPRS